MKLDRLSPEKKHLLITLGDPLGIGPEIIAKSIYYDALPGNCNYTLIGCRETLMQTAEQLGLELCDSNSNTGSKSKFTWNIIDMPFLNQISSSPYNSLDAIKKEPHLQAGICSMSWVKKAAELCLENKAAGMITGPICKESWNLAGSTQMGHTDLLASMCGLLGHERLLLILGKLRVLHVTCHMSIRDALTMITLERVLESIRIAYKSALSFKNGKNPSIAVCGLNPHAGEAGLMGREEIEIIEPAINEARKEGIHLTGPLPADTIFARARSGEFDMVIAMLHDQGHVAVKTLGSNMGGKRDFRGVNATLGLPFVRTSVDHGVAFDIVGKDLASYGSLVDAARAALKLVG